MHHRRVIHSFYSMENPKRERDKLELAVYVQKPHLSARRNPVISIMSMGMEMQLLLIIVALWLGGSGAYNVPKATVKVNSPNGFEVSIPDEPGISLFAFHGKVNEEMDDLTDQTWAADILSARNGRWTYRNRNHKLQPGDVLYYWTTARYHGVDYHNYNQRHVVGAGGGNTQRIDARGKAGGHQPIVVNGQPTINIYVA